MLEYLMWQYLAITSVPSKHPSSSCLPPLILLIRMAPSMPNESDSVLKDGTHRIRKGPFRLIDEGNGLSANSPLEIDDDDDATVSASDNEQDHDYKPEASPKPA